MIQKILDALKREYAALGLGDEILHAQASSLAAMNVVTDENLEQVVLGQKEFLEALQRGNDKRAGDAAEKARKTLLKETEELKAKLAEAEKKAKEVLKLGDKPKEEKKEHLKETKDVNEDDNKNYNNILEAIMNAQKEAQKNMESKMEELVKQHSEALADVKRLKGEVEEARKAEAVKAREQFILSEAQRLGITQGRIEEGFVIADDATNEAIQTYLAKVASNQQALSAPELPSYKLAGDDASVKALAASVAEAMVGK